MSEQDADITSSWDVYWQGARDAAAFTGGGSSHPAVTGFWDAFFREAATSCEQPLVVDTDNVIIVGHTRYKALLELGWEKVPSIVSGMDKKLAKRYRLIDNSTGELSSWDWESLKFEIREIEEPETMPGFSEDTINRLLQDITDVADRELNQGNADNRSISQDQVQQTQDRMDKAFQERSETRMQSYIDVTCPHCGEDITLDRDEVLRR